MRRAGLGCRDLFHPAPVLYDLLDEIAAVPLFSAEEEHGDFVHLHGGDLCWFPPNFFIACDENELVLPDERQPLRIDRVGWE